MQRVMFKGVQGPPKGLSPRRRAVWMLEGGGPRLKVPTRELADHEGAIIEALAARGPYTVEEVAQDQGASVAAMAHTLDDLERHYWVESRKVYDEDGRHPVPYFMVAPLALEKGSQMGFFGAGVGVRAHIRRGIHGAVSLVKQHVRHVEPGEGGEKKKPRLPHRSKEDLLADTDVPIVVNTSGGKDSQAMLDYIMRTVPSAKERVVLVNADLGSMEWAVHEHLERQAVHYGVPLNVVKPLRTLLQSIRERGMWPDSTARYCTSDHKRDPIAKWIRNRWDDKSGAYVISALGERKDESAGRRKRLTKSGDWHINERLTIENRSVYTWHPISDMSTEDVFETIEESGLPAHGVYGEGMRRLSCSFCVFATKADLQIAKRLRPELYKELVQLEADIGHAFRSYREPVLDDDGNKIKEPATDKETGEVIMVPNMVHDIDEDGNRRREVVRDEDGEVVMVPNVVHDIDPDTGKQRREAVLDDQGKPTLTAKGNPKTRGLTKVEGTKPKTKPAWRQEGMRQKMQTKTRVVPVRLADLDSWKDSGACGGDCKGLRKALVGEHIHVGPLQLVLVDHYDIGVRGRMKVSL